MNKRVSKTYLTAATKRALRKQTSAIDADSRHAFDSKFARWKKSWFEGGLGFNSDPHSRAAGSEFDELIALGPAVLPLLIEKLADPENLLALQLYDAMQTDGKLVVDFDAADERILEGEQGRARRVVQAWFANQ